MVRYGRNEFNNGNDYIPKPSNNKVRLWWQSLEIIFLELRNDWYLVQNLLGVCTEQPLFDLLLNWLAERFKSNVKKIVPSRTKKSYFWAKIQPFSSPRVLQISDLNFLQINRNILYFIKYIFFKFYFHYFTFHSNWNVVTLFFN